MKHIINFLGALLAVVLISSTFTACAENDDNGSANIGLGFKAFFPTKVVTNQPMTINGSGFNSVTEIEFPGGTKVTNFERVSNEMIRVDAPAGIPADGGKIVVRTAENEAESPLALTLGHTNVTGFSKQPGEKATGGDLITVYGTDLEFINSVELLDADGLPQLIDHKDFYRKGTDNLVFRVPQQNIYKGTFVGTLHTYDGLSFSLPELAYEPGAAGGHWEIVKTSIWKNDGSIGATSWGSEYRFSSENAKTGEECYAFPMDVWEKLKTEPFKVTIKGASPQIRVTDGWWTATWTGEDIFPGNERLEDNGDGTYALTVDLTGDPLVNLIDVQHLLFTGSGYAVDEIYFEEEVWVDGPGDVEVKVPVWENKGTIGATSWGSEYRFASEEGKTGEECYAFPMDVWERMKTETFYVTIKGESPQIRVTSGWWTSTWTGDDIFPGNELLTDNGDGTYSLAVTLAGDPLLDLVDVQHLLFTGSGYSVEDIYFIELVPGGAGDTEDVFWENGGTIGATSWGSEYRFASEEGKTGEECYAFPMDIWERMKTETFYAVIKGESPQIRVTDGWWTITWTGDDIFPGNEHLTDNGDGTYTLAVKLSDDPLAGIVDVQHLLFTGSGYSVEKLFFK